MSLLEWIILGIIFAAGAVVCVIVHRTEKKSGPLPGSMCCGCPHTASVDRTGAEEEKPRP